MTPDSDYSTNAPHGFCKSSAAGSPLDLSQFSDDLIFEAISKTKPEFIQILRDLIRVGATDDAILGLCYMANGSAQALRFAKRCLSVLRRPANKEVDRDE